MNEVDKVFGAITPPANLGDLARGTGAEGISLLLSRIVELFYIAGSLVFVFMVIMSAFQWIMSGGDKEAVSKARGRLTYAVIGIFLLALSFVIIALVGRVTGFTFFAGQK